MPLRRFLHSLSLLALIITFIQSTPVTWAQAQFQTSKAQAMLASMTPEERVGQLFLVTFRGIDTHDQTEIYDLIANYHVGGVVLLAGNDNFLPAPDTIPSAYQLISSLQRIEAETAATPGVGAEPDGNNYVPLLIGISQEGDGSPHDQILSGLTPLPNLMAIGATWNTELARQVGAVLGSELSALGFNLYLGPSLDVVEDPDPDARFDLGTRVFGGDPFWVGEMGRAYIAGLHSGSNSRMMVIAKHFPGRGASDRSPEEEVATVRKTLEQLKQGMQQMSQQMRQQQQVAGIHGRAEADDLAAGALDRARCDVPAVHDRGLAGQEHEPRARQQWPPRRRRQVDPLGGRLRLGRRAFLPRVRRDGARRAVLVEPERPRAVHHGDRREVVLGRRRTHRPFQRGRVPRIRARRFAPPHAPQRIHVEHEERQRDRCPPLYCLHGEDSRSGGEGANGSEPVPSWLQGRPADHYGSWKTFPSLRKLIAAGHKVAIAEPAADDPKRITVPGTTGKPAPTEPEQPARPFKEGQAVEVTTGGGAAAGDSRDGRRRDGKLRRRDREAIAVVVTRRGVLAQVVEAAAATRTFVLVNFRPEYRAEWTTRSYYRQLPLEPLGREDTQELLNDLIGQDPSAAGLPDLIRARTGGNPFFTEEVVLSLVEGAVLAGSRGEYRLVRPLETIEIPATVQAVLAARIDRLGPEDKTLLQTAAVIGKDVPFALLLSRAVKRHSGTLAGVASGLLGRRPVRRRG